MKRFFLSVSGILVMVVFFSACYYFSFRNTVKHLEDSKTRQDNIFPELIAESEEESKTEAADRSTDSVVSLEASAAEDIITADTVCVYRLYYLDNGEQAQYEVPPGADMAGLTRTQLSYKLRRYMEELSVLEYEAGLLSYEILSFSPERVVLQKVYDRNRVQYKYFVTIKNDEVVVFYSDKKTVFEYTGIIQSGLEEQIQTALQIGIPVKDVEELYDFLSGITS